MAKKDKTVETIDVPTSRITSIEPMEVDWIEIRPSPDPVPVPVTTSATGPAASAIVVTKDPNGFYYFYFPLTTQGLAWLQVASDAINTGTLINFHFESEDGEPVATAAYVVRQKGDEDESPRKRTIEKEFILATNVVASTIVTI